MLGITFNPESTLFIEAGPSDVAGIAGQLVHYHTHPDSPPAPSQHPASTLQGMGDILSACELIFFDLTQT